MIFGYIFAHWFCLFVPRTADLRPTTLNPLRLAFRVSDLAVVGTYLTPPPLISSIPPCQSLAICDSADSCSLLYMHRFTVLQYQ